MTEEDFIAWREHPVTQWFMQAYKISAELCRERWNDGSWETGVADQAALSELKHKSETFASVYEADFDDIQARHDEHQRD